MRYYAVIDTNVLVSAMMKMNSIPWQMVAESLTGKVIPLLNEEILEEYRSVLNRPKFRFPKSAIEALLDGLIRRGILIDAVSVEDMILDPEDIIFYEDVMEARKNGRHT